MPNETISRSPRTQRIGGGKFATSTSPFVAIWFHVTYVSSLRFALTAVLSDLERRVLERRQRDFPASAFSSFDTFSCSSTEPAFSQ
eukprot:5844695-Amphidinium_carterae.1